MILSSICLITHVSAEFAIHYHPISCGKKSSPFTASKEEFVIILCFPFLFYHFMWSFSFSFISFHHMFPNLTFSVPVIIISSIVRF